jgi:hypothetical protein
MVFGFLSGFFDKEQQEIRRSKHAYEACWQYRRARLAEFRQAAVREFSFVHPDAKFLMNTNCEDFMVYTKHGGVTLSGIFCDHVFPHLDTVGENAGPTERMRAVNSFKEKIRRYGEEPFLDVDWRRRKEIPSELATKGYHVKSRIDNNSIHGIFLERNKAKFTYASLSSGCHIGGMADCLYDIVVHKPIRTENGISVITLSVEGLEQDELIPCRIVYDDWKKFSGEAGFAEFKKTFEELGVFLSHIEPELVWSPAKDG